MAVGQQRDTEVTTLGDTRRRVAFRAFGARRILLNVQAALDDLEGAVAAGQYDTAVLNARRLVLECLSIRSLAVAGELDPGSVSFDPFAGLDAEEIADGLRLVELDLDQLTDQRVTEWMRELAAYLRATEALLGYDPPLPVLRSPEGVFGALRLARTWSGLLKELNLPDLLPSTWSQPEK